MKGKQSKDDEIPLTVSKFTILQETKARFDSLLKAARNQEDVQSSAQKKIKKPLSTSTKLKDFRVTKKRTKWKLSSSSQKLVSDDDYSSHELDVTEHSIEIPSNTTAEEVKRATQYSSSDESLTSYQQGQALTTYHKNVTLMQSKSYLIDTPTSNNSPVRPIPLPRRRQSTQDGSRETTSSRVSSPDSVMTAIDAGSPVKSCKSSSSDQVFHRSPTAHEENCRGKETEDQELKPLKRFSPSYEEIDETSLDGKIFENRYLNHTTVPQEASGMQNAASYEEILDNDQNRSDQLGSHQGSHYSESIRDSPHEHIHHAKRHRHSRKVKLKMSSRRSKARGESSDTDSSSNNAINRVSKERINVARKKMAPDVQDIESQSNIHYTYENIIGVSIHRCDALKIDSLIRHPMVRVHILDSTSGEYLKKSQQCRNVSYFQEPASIDCIQPLTSHPCSFKDPRSLIPIWGETLLFNEDITHILCHSVIFFFEVVDCVSFDTAVMQYQKLGSESGWHRIAWAFLKPCGPKSLSNINRRLRLQLYKPCVEKSFSSQSDCDKCDVYRWWSKGGWIQYPSTLHITILSLPSPCNVQPALRSSCALQPEQCLMDTDLPDEDSKNLLQDKARTSRTSSLASDVVWSRLPMQSCKVPNNQESNISTGVNGTFSIKFSHRGCHLAVTAATQNMHKICIYEVPSFVEVMCFQGHPGLVYSLDWSPNDELLLSASADCTASVWSLKIQKQLQMLPHPSFVYCALFVPGNSLSLATGCCDKVIRIWRKSNDILYFELHQELIGHEGYVSTLCVNASGHLFSGDSVGLIRIWQQQENFWNLLRELDIRELEGTVLNHLVPHPGGRRLLVIARDSLLRMIDINTGVAIQWFKGALNYRIYSNASISPCGGLVFAPSEDGTFHVWNADTGQLIASYSSLFHSIYKLSSNERQSLKTKKTAAILSGAIDYHPFEHMAAFSVYGAHAPVVICNYKKNSFGKDIGLHFVHGKEQQKELDSSNIVWQSGIDSVAESIADLSNTEPNSKFDRKHVEQITDFMSNSTLVYNSVHKGVDSKNLDKGKHQLSDIIRQLDYVLQLSRMSKQHENQLHSIRKRDACISPTLSPLQGSSPAKISEKKEEKSCILMSKEEGNEVTNTRPCSVNELHQEQQEDLLNSKQSNSEHTPPAQIHVSQPVKLHFVQEKKHSLLKSGKRKLNTIQAGKVKSQTDLSSTDTSLSSENVEEFVNLRTKNMRPPHP